MRPLASEIHDYMFEVNLAFERIGGVMSNQDVKEVVPLEVMKANSVFTDYIINSSER